MNCNNKHFSSWLNPKSLDFLKDLSKFIICLEEQTRLVLNIMCNFQFRHSHFPQKLNIILQQSLAIWEKNMGAPFDGNSYFLRGGYKFFKKI